APRPSTQSRVASREAVPITVSSVSCRASCTSTDPTPPLAPTTSSVLPYPLPGCTPSRSNSYSQAVTVVNGMAAASAMPRLSGARPTMRSSTHWYSALLPGRVTSLAYQTLSPGRNRLTPLLTASTTPAASQPSTLYPPCSG